MKLLLEIFPSLFSEIFPQIKSELTSLLKTEEVNSRFIKCELENNYLNLVTSDPIAENDLSSYTHYIQIENKQALENIINLLNSGFNKSSFENYKILDSLTTRKQSSVPLDIIKQQAEVLKNQIDSAKKIKDRPSKYFEHLDKSSAYLKQYFLFNSLSNNPEHVEKYLDESNRLVLLAEVEYNFAIHFQIDPSLGWINYPDISSNTQYISFSNPFLSLLVNKENGIIKNINYISRKFSLNQFKESMVFSLETKGDFSSKPPSVMRKNPDIYGIKFFQKLSSEIEISKCLYIKSGLVPLGNYSTTGYELEFWNELSTSSNTNLKLSYSQRFNCKIDFVNFRILGDVGGVSDYTVQFNGRDKISITKNECPGGLDGIRTIDAINQLVCDYRFSKSIESIDLTLDEISLDYTVIKISFNLEAGSIDGYENAQNLTFSIY